MHNTSNGTNRQPVRNVDIVGIGIGPFNVSLAAVLQRAPELTAHFLEATPSFSWHPGLLFADACLQSPIYKDCTTMIDPTSEYTFLNFLARTHRLNKFVIAEFPTILRREFNQYLQWVCEQLDNMEFNARVNQVQHDGSAFLVKTAHGVTRATELVLGVGRNPFVPSAMRPFLGETVFHGGEYLKRTFERRDKRILVVGGGQTGAEIYYDLIRDPQQLPTMVTWLTRRHNFIPFDESPFANELYVPGYTRHFYGRPAGERERLLTMQKYSSDGILQPLLLDIYRRIYELDYLETRRMETQLLVDREVTFLKPTAQGWQAIMETPQSTETIYADVVILATGFQFEVPSFLDPIRDRIELDEQGRFRMNEDFSLQTNGLGNGRIYAHNAALHTHGWVDPNFAAMAWRSGVITNSLARREVYDLSASGLTVSWAGVGQDEPLVHAEERDGVPAQ